MAVSDELQTLQVDQRQQPQAQQLGSPSPPAAPPPLPPAAVRPYLHAHDSARLAYICRNVYGGTDDLPQRVASLHSQPGTHLLAACTGGKGVHLDALLCCQERGDVLWLFGARTAEELRGNGLAGLLLAEAEGLACTLLGAAALLSITVPANHTMRRLFARRGFLQQRRVVAWPETPVALAAHERMAGAAQQQQQQQQQQGAVQALSFLQALPAAAAVADTPAARALLPSWRRCTSVAELQAVLLQLRQADPQRQLQHGAEEEEDGMAAALGAESALPSGPAGTAAVADHAARPAAAAGAAVSATLPDGASAVVQRRAVAAAAATAGAPQVPAQLPADSCAFHWLPGEYELLPAGGPAVQQLVEQGAVWLLQAPSHAAASPIEAGAAAKPTAAAADVAAQDGGAATAAADAAGDAAVLVCFGPGFRGMRHAGIVAGSSAALESALLHASAVADPQCCRFYIDSCGFDHPQLWASTGGPRIDILPFFKPLAA